LIPPAKLQCLLLQQKLFTAAIAGAISDCTGLQSIVALLVASCLLWASVLSISCYHAVFCGLCHAKTQQGLWSQQHSARTGRRDDLWSWLYVLVEMLDGGLCWRIGKDKADRRAEDASRHLNSKHMDAEKQKKKEIALKRKQAALTDPDLLTANVVLPGAEQVLMPLQSVLRHKMCNK